MRRMLELIGVLALVFSFATCGLLAAAASGPSSRGSIVVRQNADGSVAVEEVAPWWANLAAGAVAALGASIGAVWLNNRAPTGTKIVPK